MNKKIYKFISYCMLPLIMSSSAKCELNLKIKREIANLVKLDLSSIGKGEYGKVYKFEKYPEYAVKKHNSDDKEYDISTKLIGVQHENLMQVVDVINEEISVYKYIKGNILKYEICKINMSLKHFLEKWCIGLIDAMRLFSEKTEMQLDDIYDENIMITGTKEEPIPILIDFSLGYQIEQGNEKCFNGTFIEIAKILYHTIDNEHVKSTDNNVNIFKEVKEYLASLKNPKYYPTINEVINKFKEFSANCQSNN